MEILGTPVNGLTGILPYFPSDAASAEAGIACVMVEPIAGTVCALTKSIEQVMLIARHNTKASLDFIYVYGKRKVCG